MASRRFSPSRPWHRYAIPPRRRVTLDARSERPLAQLDIYHDLLILTRREKSRWLSYPISAEAMATALGRFPASSGLLPAGTIATGTRNGSAFYVQYRPAHEAALQVETASVTTLYRVQLPPLIWAGCGYEYRVFALATTEPPTLTTRLYIPPLPNTYRDGGICWGTARPPLARGEGLDAAWRLFSAESQFNTHVAGGHSRAYPANILMQLARLHESGESYPLDDLVASTYTLEALLGGIWR